VRGVAERVKPGRREPKVAVAPSSSRKPSSAPAQPSGTAKREVGGFTGLTGVQVFHLVVGLITAPLIARALGAEGRGLLAAVVVPLGVCVPILELGLPLFAINQAAKGVHPRLLLGSLALPLLVVSGLVALLAPFIAGVISTGREPVEQYLTIGLAVMPVGVLALLVSSIAWGLSKWRVLVLGRLLPPLVILVGVVTLYGTGNLTVKTAAALTILSGLTSILAIVPILHRLLPPRLDLRLVRRGLGFGLRGWLGTLGNVMNLRLDQLLMIPLVPARELGLYAVAATVSSLSNVLTSQVVTVLVPRIASGESHLLPQAVRCVFLVVLGCGTVIALATQFLLVPVFGADFAGAVPLVFVLLAAWFWQAGLSSLSLALPALNRPGAPAIGEFVSLAITVPGLILLLPALGAMGAAVVSFVAYATTFAVLLAITTRHLAQRAIDYMVPRGTDVMMLASLVLSFSRVLAPRRASAG
jgi:O-antigen/teichoic acid export membrane protein